MRVRVCRLGNHTLVGAQSSPALGILGTDPGGFGTVAIVNIVAVPTDHYGWLAEPRRGE